MASYGHAMPASTSKHSHGHGGHGHGHGHGQAATYGAPIQAGPGAPAGTFSPGTKIQVGSHRVVIQKYLSEGGFAHVYLVKLPQPVSGTDLAVLKRVAVPDKEALRGMRIEVETMKRLKGHRAIVTYIDSHASELRGGGYEVFLLMEYCDGGGLIDFMNTRLQHRLTEPEILQIFTDVAEGVACMHYLKPPLLHRDLKVENVLITHYGSTRKFKLCDFGSAAAPKPAPTTVVECRLMDEDVQKHTTLQYRSPEMIDVYRKQPIDEKSDIWALGVLLYKLCYYTTPFEDQGQLAILNASFKYPSYPVFSDRLKKLIASMLQESQHTRPNIYQVLKEGCAMQGRDTPIKDIYSGRSQSEPRATTGSESPAKNPPPTAVVGASFAAPPKPQQAIPDVVPMRRGRPPSTTAQQQQSQQPTQQPQGARHKPSPSPMRVTNGDPFAALDQKFNALGLEADELSTKFPTLDQFSILHEQVSKFSFDDNITPDVQKAKEGKDLSQRVTERLADEAFVTSPANPQQQQFSEMDRSPGKSEAALAPVTSPPINSHSAPPRSTEMSRASAIISSTPELKALSSPNPELYQQPAPSTSRPTMVSTGTMTSTPPPEQYQVYRFPPTDQHRSSSVPRVHETRTSAGVANVGRPRVDTPPSQSTAISRVPSFTSQSAAAHTHARHPSSSRPSLEGGRPSADFLEPSSKPMPPVNPRPRPVSTHLESSMDYLRQRERSPQPLLSPGLSSTNKMERAPSPDGNLLLQDDKNIASNVQFLRSMEDPESRKKDKSSFHHNHHHHKHGKRSSLTSLSGTKNILAGKFGDAFKRFESNNPNSAPPPPRTPSPLKQLGRRDLTPIAGSEATDGRSDDGDVLEETNDMTPEMRREIERRRLSQEEKRVAAAQAEYRQRLARRDSGGGGGSGVGGTAGTMPLPSLPKSIGGVSRAVSIQNKVQSLLEESTKPTHVTRTAHGYGHFTDSGPSAPVEVERPERPERPEIPRKPLVGSGISTTGASTIIGARSSSVSSGHVQMQMQTQMSSRPVVGNKPDAYSMPPSMVARQPLVPSASGVKPMAPPKPTHLNKNLSGISSGGRPASPPKPSGLMSKPLPRMPPTQQQPQSLNTQQQQFFQAPDLPGQPVLDMSPQERDDYLRDFAKRFPSLTSIEMVERDLAAEAAVDAQGGGGSGGGGGGGGGGGNGR